MKRLAIVLLALTNLASAKPAFLPVPLTYASLTPAGQIAADNGAPDKPEVARTQLDDRVNEATRSQASRQSSPPTTTFINNGLSSLTQPAPLGADGRVVDTAEVAAAKAAHTAAHANERLNLANEAARSGGASEVADNSDTPGVRVDEKIDLARIVDGGGAVVPLVFGNGVVVTALLPVDPELPEVNDAKTVDALAVAGPALAYGRLVY
ncbi:PREDICTED: uncharacterized protein LOC106746649 [Dinoponera quadriceps]|uniref:Uncharacterized protein LOC106746649 n=1 Tax=Dinoponera quadriceps TaxID=609295 RepID=A0A6P3XKD9_DINQU|nr:PREDICTED: uncharacterized protein LOC106746649 [Dinoponera quadriceps]